MDFTNFHQKAMEKLNKDFEEEDNQNQDHYQEDAPLTPTQSEFDTFQVLSNSNLVDFKKEKFSSKSLSPIASFGKTEEVPNIVDEDFPYPYSKEKFEDERDYERDHEDHEDHERDHERNHERNHEREESQKPYLEEMGETRESKVPPYIRPDPQFVSSKKLDALSQVDSINSDVEEEIEYEKQALLEELQGLKNEGVYNPVKNLTLKDSLEEIQFQYDKVQSEISTSQGVQMVISGIKMGSSILETLLKKFGFSSVDGFSQNLCKDPSKFNRPVTKLYKRYWRKGNMSPEAELSMIILGSLAWTIVQNKMTNPPSPKILPPTPSPSYMPPPPPPNSYMPPHMPPMPPNSYMNQPYNMPGGNVPSNEMGQGMPYGMPLQGMPPQGMPTQAMGGHGVQRGMYHHQNMPLEKVHPLPIQPYAEDMPARASVIPPPPKVNLQQFSDNQKKQTISPSSLAKKTESKKTITLGSRNSSINSTATKKKTLLQL